MSALLPLPVAIPLVGTALSMLAVRHRRLQRLITASAILAAIAVSIAIVVMVSRDGTTVSNLGGWRADVTIMLVADRLSAVMLLFGMGTAGLVLLFAFGQGGTDEASPYYHPAYLALVAGMALAFLAGDLFNLFVAFEVLLMASYVLITLEGKHKALRHDNSRQAGSCIAALNET